MSAVKIAGLFGSGTLGVLVVGLFASKLMNAGWEPLFGVAIFVFVGAGAVALVVKALPSR
jgi:hypothetical protein